MFLCYVITGESVSLPKQKLKVPPLKSEYSDQLRFSNKSDFMPQNHGQINSQFKNNQIMTERFDSVTNENNSHHVIYDFNKQYPGYLITYLWD